jgi:hypothetical protein
MAIRKLLQPQGAGLLPRDRADEFENRRMNKLPHNLADLARLRNWGKWYYPPEDEVNNPGGFCLVFSFLPNGA